MWVYFNGTGDLYLNNTRVATGYAGVPSAVNDSSKQHLKDIGPIPRGMYVIGAPVNSARTGPFTLSLTPDRFNQMFGRADFKMHGDTSPPGNASEGCIIQSRSVRERVWKSGDTFLVVV